jgi:hypothetical protein
LNGVMIDIHDIANPAGIDADDFIFKVGNDDDPQSWAAAPAPSSITVHPRDGVFGSDRVTLIWDDNAIENQWLEVTVKATADTGLAESDVFYFGSAIGDVSGDGFTGLDDALQIWANRKIPGVHAPASVTDRYDINRDGWVGLDDALLAWANRMIPGADPGLQLIGVPASAGAQPPASAPLVQVETEDKAPVIPQPTGPSRRLAAALWRQTHPAEVPTFALRGVDHHDDDTNVLDALLNESHRLVLVDVP